MELQGRLVLVTGASSGIGAEIARAMAGRPLVWSARHLPRTSQALVRHTGWKRPR